MYLLDSNVFIDASRHYYAPDIAPTFWDWLAQQHKAGNVASVARVRQEIDDGKGGHLKTWAATLPATFWLKPDLSQPSFAALSAWTVHPDRPYFDAARQEFMSVTDYYLVAQAHDGGHQLVTSEQSRPEAKKKVFIPEPCAALGVTICRPFDAYRQLGLRFY